MESLPRSGLGCPFLPSKEGEINQCAQLLTLSGLNPLEVGASFPHFAVFFV
jgi:hypothetical protein